MMAPAIQGMETPARVPPREPPPAPDPDELDAFAELDPVETVQFESSKVCGAY